MTQPSTGPDAQAPKYWNVFAAVLQEMLETKTPALGLGHLDNRPDPQTSKTIHPQRVVRLQRSLRQPIFPTLNPDLIDAVVRAFDLSFEQKVRLHAAVLATAVQSMLAGRIGARHARLAGWQVLPIIEQQLRDHWNEDGLGFARDPLLLTELGFQDDVDDFTAEYGAALSEVDRGLLHLVLAELAVDPRERRASAHAARVAFEAALAGLKPLAEEIDEAMLETGHFWQETAEQGRIATERFLT